MQKFGNLTSLLKKRQFLCECAMLSFISARFSIEGIRNQSFSVSAFSLKLCFSPFVECFVRMCLKIASL